jgi:hypothetical protein
MSELAKLIVKSGILSESQLAEFQRWGQLTDAQVEESPMSAAEFMQKVERALQEEDMVLIRETDFGALRSYLQNQKKGQLHVKSGKTESEIDVIYSVLNTGEYLIPWTGENLADLLINGETFLETDDGKEEYFYEIRELFYGEVKAFVACRPMSLAQLLTQEPSEVSALTDGAANGSDSSQDSSSH